MESEQSQPTGSWINVSVELPPAGDYRVMIERNGEIMESKKRLYVHGSSSKWFGGCRPFCENDVVLSWFKEE